MKKPLLSVIGILLFFTLSAQNITGLSVNLFTYLPNNEMALEDGVGVLFNGQSDTVDLNDALKLTNPLENIAIIRNNKLLGIEQRTTLDTIPLTLWNLQQQDYELEIITRNITDAYLEDAVTHTKQYIGAGDTLRYRFINTIANTPKDSSIKFWVVFGKIPPVNNCGSNQPPRHHNNSNNHHHGKQHRRMKVYPNPVTDSYVNLEMDNLVSGRCKVTLLGAARSLTYTFKHDENTNERLNTNGLPKGKYYLVIEDEEGWKEARQIEIN